MWLTLLKDAVDRSSRQAVADELGISRTTISLVMSGNYPAKTDKIEKLVIDHYGRIECPHLCASITIAECKQNHESAVPTSSPRAMKLWRACQSCPHNKAKGAKHAAL